MRSSIILNFWLSVSCCFFFFVVDNMQLDHLDPSFVFNEKRWRRIGRIVRSQEQQEDNEPGSSRFFYVLCFISSYISRAVQSHRSFLVISLDLYTIQKICHFRENMNGFCGSNFWETDFLIPDFTSLRSHMGCPTSQLYHTTDWDVECYFVGSKALFSSKMLDITAKTLSTSV